uniref:Eukaryotic translation initiation factor 3 subunit G n=1 Tax=Daphnia galeata TaxID=27404 RepID=A0A8J2WG43_9CRUS|nr:unnamed protein product [Daphnia galeata]
MPVADNEVKSSWADDVEDIDGLGLPPNTEEYKNGLKIVTEYGLDDDNRKFKVVRTYKIEKRYVAKAIAQRKSWPKFGLSKEDKPGPNPATTIVSEDVAMQFITNKEDPDNKEDDPLMKLKSMQKGIVKCRICKEDHWTTQCPYKDTLLPVQEALNKAEEKKVGPPPAAAAAGGPQAKGGKEGSAYIAPALRDGGNRKGETMAMGRRTDEGCTVRVTNLSENARDSDLQELFGRIGEISRIFLSKDKNTGQSRGFAFVSYKRREDAERAIKTLNGFGYDHLILTVEWSKPSGTQ